MSDDLQKLADEFAAMGWRPDQAAEGEELLVHLTREVRELREATADVASYSAFLDNDFARRALREDPTDEDSARHLARLEARVERIERRLGKSRDDWIERRSINRAANPNV